MPGTIVVVGPWLGHGILKQCVGQDIGVLSSLKGLGSRPMAAVCPVPSSWLCVVLALVLGLGFGLRPEIFELTLDHTDACLHIS